MGALHVVLLDKHCDSYISPEKLDDSGTLPVSLDCVADSEVWIKSAKTAFLARFGAKVDSRVQEWQVRTGVSLFLIGMLRLVLGVLPFLLFCLM